VDRTRDRGRRLGRDATVACEGLVNRPYPDRNPATMNSSMLVAISA
jgi:hypothetical protein